MAGADEEEGHPYHAKDAIAETANMAFATGVGGALVAGIQNTLTKQNVGAMGFFTKYGKTTTIFTAMGASFAFVRTVSANLRETEDPWNTAMGGFVAGSLVGLQRRTMPAFLGMGIMLSVITAVFDYGGGKLRPVPDPDVDQVARKDALRKSYRRPIDETISELGEGRGIYGPGYQERRKQRIKENYGIDVQ